ncbi:hypothetical protein [Nonomuraea sp. NPDC003709]|uniref:hypothetical protein n=1 Tax=Nonomuraea sp. NPDC003709 TaxID=3154450 RepID=UPI0033BF33BA
MRHRRNLRLTGWRLTVATGVSGRNGDQYADTTDEYPDDEKGARWAAELQDEYGVTVLVLWEVAGKHLTAFYKGPTPEGIFVKGRTPQDLRRRVSAKLGELQLARSAPVQYPIVKEILPGLLRRLG